jgi:hypothetical protein
MNGMAALTAAADTTRKIVSRKASNAFAPNAQATIQNTSPTMRATSTPTAQPPRRSSIARRTLVTALKAPFMARSAPESSGGSIPIWRPKLMPS